MQATRKRPLTCALTAAFAGVIVAGLTAASAGVSEAHIVSQRSSRGLSEAHVVRARSKVGINYGQRRKRFFGKVRSRARVCRASRIVRIIKARRRISDVLVGTTRTGRLGGWRIRRTQAHGRFYAKVIRSIRTPYGHLHQCRADISRVIRVR
jgi:hypothetical protein